MKITAVIPNYNNASMVASVVESLLEQDIWLDNSLQIIVVDDASTDGSSDLLDRRFGSTITLIRLPENCGRSAARNTGASASEADFLLFIDSDCKPACPDFIKQHLSHFKNDVVACTGPVFGCGSGFWHDYQVNVSMRRATKHANGLGYSGSTSNLMVIRDVFNRIGGFDETYKTYGFEDRDLLIRLSNIGVVAWAQEAVIEHHDALSLINVCKKMQLAGGAAAHIFSTRHPEAYRQLGYATLDTRLYPWLRIILFPIWPLLPFIIRYADKIINFPWLPFTLRSVTVKILSGLSFIRGTFLSKN